MNRNICAEERSPLHYIVENTGPQRANLEPEQAYVVYLLFRPIGAAPVLRRADDERRRKLCEARYAG